MKQKILNGIPAAPGISIGKAYLFDKKEVVIQKKSVKKDEISAEIKKFKAALTKTRKEIMEIRDKISREIGSEHGEIFSAHLLVLEDSMLIDEVISRVTEEKLVVEYIFSDVLKKYIRAFSKIDDEYLRERISDINDIGKRIIKNLVGAQHSTLGEIKKPAVVVAYDLSPSDTATMHKKTVTAFATDIGGRTSHTAIMAKSLEIPAVVGLEEATEVIKNGDTIIVDGNRGKVILHPAIATLKQYESEKKVYGEEERSLLVLRDVPSITPDGHKIELKANIELPEEIASVVYHGASGIGLYRTEFFYMNRVGLPTEEEHFKAYKEVAEKMLPNSVTIRTMDLGGDKFLSHLKVPHEMNPFLGWRAIRFCLARPEVFKVQLRAILRASVYGKLRLMYPMISGLGELKQAKIILNEAKEELRQKKMAFDENMQVGAMIETPSAALTADLLAREVDFFSIGTNDLIQYAIAVDRVNEKIAYLYEPAHPGVLRLIANVIRSAHEAKIWVGMCGEMAGEPHFAVLLLGLGLDEFSVSPIIIPEIKRIIRSVSMQQARDVAQKALTLSTGKEVEEFAKARLKELVPEFRDKNL